MDGAQFVTVDAGNVAQYGFFCQKSRRKSPGYRQKLEWLQERLAEGLRIHIAYENGHQVGFIEYIPGELAWRAVRAGGYMVIHCLWGIGRSKGQGIGSRLVGMCLEAAREKGLSARAVELRDCRQVQETAPCAYGVFGRVYDGRLLTYRPLGKDNVLDLLEREA